mgnify:CR=1 FL=1
MVDPTRARKMADTIKLLLVVNVSAAIGAFAGPPGMIAGALIGAVKGAVNVTVMGWSPRAGLDWRCPVSSCRQGPC